MPEEREYMVQLVKSLGRIEKAIEDTDTAKVLRELLAKITDVSAKAKGDKGDDGYTPVKDKDYRDGKDGRGVTRLDINEKGQLTILFSDGKEKNLGRVVGADGKDAKFDEDAMIRKILRAIEVPQVDIDALAALAAEKLPKPPTAEQIVREIRKSLSYEDLKDKPDLVDLIKKYTAHLEQQDRGVYAAPTYPLLTVKDEGTVISEHVKSIDFRGANISITDLGDGNLVATIVGGAGANIETVVVTAVQSGDDVTIDLTQLPHTFVSLQWASKNGQILKPGAMDPSGVSSWTLAGNILTIYWADAAGDSFQTSTTY